MSKKRAYYVSKDNRVCCKVVDFAHSTKSNFDKKKAINSSHRKLEKIDERKLKILDLNVRSSDELGKKLSPYQLSYNGEKLESVYQAAKYFENGKQYEELAKMPVGKVLSDTRLNNSGRVVDFHYRGEFWGRDREYFYDYLYVSAVKENFDNEEIKEIINYDYFIDIESKYSSEKNAGRSAAIIKLMIIQLGEIPTITRKEFVAFCKIFVDT